MNREVQENLEIILKTKSITFSPGLTGEQQLKSMNSLIYYLRKNNSNKAELSVLFDKHLLIGFMYRISNNGTIQIPWNWYLSD